uniref:Mobile element protein n=1 Tax=Parastrongyloides trichosuri TaxID=131310 RepID=A0A0N4ZVS2_PARTI
HVRRSGCARPRRLLRHQGRGRAADRDARRGMGPRRRARERAGAGLRGNGPGARPGRARPPRSRAPQAAHAAAALGAAGGDGRRGGVPGLAAGRLRRRPHPGGRRRLEPLQLPLTALTLTHILEIHSWPPTNRLVPRRPGGN